MTKDDDAWFAPKRFGYGAGLPIAWQGWAVLAAFLAVVFGAMAMLMPRQSLVYGAVVLLACIGLTGAAARHTRGGFRWRSGGE